jgi:hypothetical protein
VPLGFGRGFGVSLALLRPGHSQLK